MKNNESIHRFRTVQEIGRDTTTWERLTIAGSNLNVPEEQLYIHNGNMPFCYYSGVGVPCWSLAALINAMPKIQGDKAIIYLSDNDNYVSYSHFGINAQSSSLVDACYEIIIKLHEQKLL